MTMTAPDDLRVLLHVGVPKTATTAIQTCMAAARDDMLRHGVLYPGRAVNQQPALRMLIEAHAGDEAAPAPAAWATVSRLVRAHEGRAVVSGEFAALASPPIARRIVNDLGGDGVHVVITLRPLEALLASMWQQDVKDGIPTAFHDWLVDVCRGPRPESGQPHLFWYVHDHSAVAKNWMSAVGPERLHLVVVDRSQPAQVYDTFSRLLGLPAGVLDQTRSTRSNRSLSMAEAETLRRLSEQLIQRDAHALWRPVGLAQIANLMLENRRPTTDEAAIGVPAHFVHTIRAQSRRTVDGLAALGAHVVGDLESLCPTGDVPDVDIPEPETVPIDVAALLLEGLVMAAERLSR